MLSIVVPPGTRPPRIVDTHFLAVPRLDLTLLEQYTFEDMSITPSESQSQLLTPPGSPSEAQSTTQLELGEYLGSGNMYDEYRARVHTTSSDRGHARDLNVVVKFCDPWIVGTPRRNDRFFGEKREIMENARDIVGAVDQAAAVYRRLQHTTIVPRFYGLWEGLYFDGTEHFQLLAMVLEDVGASLHPLILPSSAGNLVPSFLQLYKILHNEGIVHGNIDSRHVHIRLPTFDVARIWDYPPASDAFPYSETRPDPSAPTTLPLPSLCLIDFEGACLRSEKEYEEELDGENMYLEHLEEQGIVRAERKVKALQSGEDPGS